MPANVNVKNSATGAMSTKAAKRSRFEKSEIAYGTIPAGAYAVGDTLVFANIPSKEIIHARFVAGTGKSLELFCGANLSTPVAWNVANGGATSAISYVVTYIRGTGNGHYGLANAATESAGEKGVEIRITVSSGATSA